MQIKGNWSFIRLPNTNVPENCIICDFQICEKNTTPLSKQYIDILSGKIYCCKLQKEFYYRKKQTFHLPFSPLASNDVSAEVHGQGLGHGGDENRTRNNDEHREDQ
ncbi:unnamed protein product [Heterotrigona itama]|uniref:Uncharacterized protein n=1 Tax=Heterotrigona itama TaxID=395501 RepID=A0A6V7H7E8_9HYME|nr:unnamed protein product [Heterotrigona itama]